MNSDVIYYSYTKYKAFTTKTVARKKNKNSTKNSLASLTPKNHFKISMNKKLEIINIPLFGNNSYVSLDKDMGTSVIADNELVVLFFCIVVGFHIHCIAEHQIYHDCFNQ